MQLDGYEFYAKDAPIMTEEHINREVASWNSPMLTLDACKIASKYKDRNSGRESFCLVEENDTPGQDHCCWTLCLDCVRILARVWENVVEELDGLN